MDFKLLASSGFVKDAFKGGVNKFSDVVKKQFGPNLEFATPKQKAQIAAAAKELGLTEEQIPKSWLTTNKDFQTMEGGLLQDVFASKIN